MRDAYTQRFGWDVELQLPAIPYPSPYALPYAASVAACRRANIGFARPHRDTDPHGDALWAYTQQIPLEQSLGADKPCKADVLLPLWRCGLTQLHQLLAPPPVVRTPRLHPPTIISADDLSLRCAASRLAPASAVPSTVSPASSASPRILARTATRARYRSAPAGSSAGPYLRRLCPRRLEAPGRQRRRQPARGDRVASPFDPCPARRRAGPHQVAAARQRPCPPPQRGSLPRLLPQILRATKRPRYSQ
jgi:hypothetical protein